MSRANMTSSHRCAARSRAGKPCQMAALKRGRYCWNHSPAVSKQRAAARSRGGRRGLIAPAQGSADVSSIAALQGHVGQALADVLLRPSSEKKAASIARLVECARKLIVEGEVEQQLALLAARLDELEER
jgi:hypothetical protein